MDWNKIKKFVGQIYVETQLSKKEEINIASCKKDLPMIETVREN